MVVNLKELTASAWGRTVCAAALMAVFAFGAPTASAQTTVANTATVAPPAGATDPSGGCSGSPAVCTGNNTATDTDTVVSPQLSFAKTHTGNFSVGANGVYTLTVSNTGTSPTTGTITVVDTLPTGLSFVSATGTGWTCSAAGQVVTCTSTTAIANGAAGNPITLTVAVAAAAAPSVTNTARASGGGDATCPASGATQPRCMPSDPTTVDAAADLSITKTDGATTYVPGTSTTYTVVVANAGPSAAAGVAVVDNAPAGTTITGWTCTGAACPAANGTGNVNQTIASLASGASVSYAITLAIPSGFTAALTNTATVNATTADPTPANNSASDTDTAAASADVAITKSQATPNPALPGQPVTWTITATNNGPSDAQMSVSDTVPASVTGLTLGGANAASCAVAGQTVTCDFGTRPTGDVRTFTISGTLSNTATGTLSNTATVSTTANDPTPGNNTATSNTPIGTAAQVSVSKTGPATVVAGASYSYTLSLANAGQAPTGSNLVVQDQLPTGVVVTAAAGANCGALPSAPGALLSCVVSGPIAGGGSAVVTLTATAPATPGNLVNYAATNPTGTGNPGTPPGPGCVPGPAVSCSSASTTVTAPQLTLTKSHAGNFTVGVNGSYTLSVANTGSSPTTGTVTVVDTLPNGLGFVSATGAGWTCNAAGQVVTCNSTAVIANGASGAPITLTVTVGPAASPSVTNTARASGGGDATCPASGASAARCSFSDPTTVGVTPIDAVVDDFSGTPINGAAGGNTPSVLTNDTLGGQPVTVGPGGTVTLTPGASPNPGLSMNPDGTITVAPGTPANSYTFQYTICEVANPTNCDTTTATVVVGVPSLSLAKTAGTPADVNGNGITDAGDTIAYSFVVTNSGSLALSGVAVTDAKLSATPIACTPATLAPGATANCGPVTYTVTAADVTAGSVDNSATASGTPATGPAVTSAPSTTSTPTAAAAPSLTVAKTAGTPVDVNGNGLTDAGDTIAYSFAITNTGNVPLNGVVVNDAKLSATPIACTPATVAVGGTASCGPVTYTITAADVTAGSVDNSATATGTPPGGSPTTSPPSTTTTPTTAPAPSLTVAKTAGAPVDVNLDGIVDAGDTIAYSFVVTNTGNVPLNGVVVNDAKLSATPIACAPATVAVGGTASCGPVDYTVTAADVAAGSVDNSATATGTPPGGSPTTSPPSTTSTPTNAPAPALTVAKTAGTPADVNGNGLTDAGDTIAYSFIVTNTGNVPLNGVVVNDAKLSATPIACTPTTVAANGGTANCGPVTYTITAADVTAGSVDNSATATGTPPGGSPTTSPPSTTTTPTTAPAPSLTVAKTAGTPVDVNGNGLTDAGDTIVYSFAITNTGNVPLNGVVVNDAKISATPIACTPTDIPVGGTANCGPVTYTITAADVTAGSVDNSATATGTPPGGSPTTSPPSTTTTPTTAPAPSLTVVKTAGTPVDVNGNGLTDAGDTIAYSFAITNTGNVPLNGVVVNDAKISATPIACTPATIPVGGTANCGPVTYTITAADVTAGSVDNSATATGTPPGGSPTTSPPSTTTTPVTAPAPALTVAKTAGAPTDVNGNGLTDAGDTIAYSFAITNTGNVPLNGVVVNDAKLSATPIACTPATVAVGGTASCGPVTYTITAADVTAGSVDNSATATGTPPGGTPVTSAPSTTSTPTTAPTPALTLAKTAGAPADVNGNGITDAGDTIAYSFVATNSGNTPLNGVVVNDAKISATPIACTPATIPVGGTANCGPVTYTITPADVTAGSVDNSATATGTPPGGAPVTSAPSTTSTPTTAPAPALTLVKTAGAPVDANGNGLTDAGDTITYGFVATNSGNTPLNGVVVNDAKISAVPIACTPATIPAGGTANCGPVTYTITAADVTAGSVDNSATATGTPPGGTPVTSAPSTTSTPTTAPAPALTVVKTAGAPVDANGNGITDAGDTIAYSFVATNSGNTPLNGVVVNDAKISATPIACTPATIPAGGTANCGPITYTITAADVTAGSVDNSATATGTPPGGTPVTSAPSTTSTPTTAPAPALTLAKTAGTPVDANGNGVTDAGDTIAYRFVATNAGNTPLNGVVVNDAKISATPIACTPTDIPAGGTANCGPVTYTITAADVTAGSVDNSATATGTPPGGTPVTSAPSTTSTPVVAPAPSLSSLKTLDGSVDADASGGISVGDTLTYSITVTNTGNVALNNVVITDSRLTPSTIACGNVTPNTTCVLTGVYVVTQADADAGAIVNTAGVVTDPPPNGTPLPPEACPAGSTAPRCAPTLTTTVVQRPAIAATKTATLTTDTGTQGVGNPGDVVTYAVTVANTGNVTVSELTVVDTLEGGTPTTLTCAPTTLSPGQSATCTPYTHTITEAEAGAGGTLDNSVSASARGGTGAQSVTVTATSTAAVRIEAESLPIRLVKTATPRDVKVGDLVRYTVSIQNTGTTDVVDGTLIDTPPAGFSYVDGSLAVADGDAVGRLVGTYPIRVDRLDVAAGARATLTYLLRVGAGVRPGVHRNTALVQDDGANVSNVATADVQLVSDPVLDESLILGTVYDDRDGDGWQDAAALTGLRVQGGFAPGAYVPDSTSIVRGDRAVPEADASAPLLHGIDLGDLSARQSEADPADAHAVVVRQTLSALDFSDDFALTSAQGVTVRMDAAGNTRVERSGDAAKGLTAAEPTVTRRVSQVADGYRVDYVIANNGVDEHGIPGVRIASVEGLIVETDPFGRYHLLGVDGGPQERGRNFILKVDPATLPPGTTFTSDNPLVRRVTPGLPVRFDFGAKLPPGLVEGGEQAVEMALGTVIFDAGSATIRDGYRPVIEKMAEQVRAHRGGEVVIAADGDSQALAYERAKAVQAALLAGLPPERAGALTVSLRTDVDDAASTVLTLDGATPVLGTVLFDTDRADIKPEYAPVIAKIAEDIAQLRGGTVGVVGHADRRGSDAYNVALGLRRAKAVFDAIARTLAPEVRSRLRVEISDNPTAPVGIRGQ